MNDDRWHPLTTPLTAFGVLYIVLVIVTVATGFDLKHVATVVIGTQGIGFCPILAAWVADRMGARGAVQLQVPLMGKIQNAALCWRCLSRLALGKPQEHTHLTRWD